MGQAEKAALLIIGNEILSGRTADKNVHYIAAKMTERGAPLAEVRVVPDIEDKVVGALNALRDEYDYVFTTGGIGPTHDDITASCVAKAFELPFEQHKGAYQSLLDYYGEADLTEARLRMAMMPRGAKLIPNPISGAPGFNVENVYVMAGVPKIMQAMLESVLDDVTPGDPIYSNTVGCHTPESEMAVGLGDIQKKYPHVDVGSYPQFRSGVLGVSVVLKSTNAEAVRDATKAVIKLIEDKGDTPQDLGFQVPLG